MRRARYTSFSITVWSITGKYDFDYTQIGTQKQWNVPRALVNCLPAAAAKQLDPGGTAPPCPAG